METKSNHRVNIVRIKEIRVHPNADKLEIYPIDGTDYQYVGTKGQFAVGQLVAYIQPDSVVPELPQYSFLWEPKTYEGPVPERKRRIKAKKLRKEWSEGLLIPAPNNQVYEEGSDIADLLGIYHYEPPEEKILDGDCERGPRKVKYPKTLKGWFFYLLRKVTFNYFDKYGVTDSGREGGPGFPIYDVEAFKNYKNTFIEGEPVIVTEKIHGSNFRAVFYDGKFYVGSRKLWKKEGSKCVWRRVTEQNPWIEEWCRNNPGYALYGEVTPTQDGYNYGTEKGKVKIFLFDVLKPDNTWVSWTEFSDIKYSPLTWFWVPLLYGGSFNEEAIKSFVDGPSRVPEATHRREGIVIRPQTERFEHHLGRVQLKLVSNEFLEKEK